MFIIRPISPRSESNARVVIKGEVVEVFFPPKREDFRKLMKANDFDWFDPYWKRKFKAEEVADRLVEIACKILEAGFNVAVRDETQQGRIVARDFTPEITRWIKVLTSGDYTGWFFLRWHHTEDYYKAAKKIEGSRYIKPGVAVPPEHYDQVADFAEKYGFTYSEKARDLARVTADELERAVVVSFEKVKEQKPEPGTKPAKLEVPELVEVADEFADDLA